MADGLMLARRSKKRTHGKDWLSVEAPRWAGVLAHSLYGLGTFFAAAALFGWLVL
jgi:hypothetical protein